jgi:hypothetical protein
MVAHDSPHMRPDHSLQQAQVQPHPREQNPSRRRSAAPALGQGLRHGGIQITLLSCHGLPSPSSACAARASKRPGIPPLCTTESKSAR